MHTYGRPSRGVLKDIMARTRNMYHYSIRRVKKMSGAHQASKLFEASEKGSVDLLKEMKIIKGSKKADHDLPDLVAGVTGEDLIVEEFRKMYQTLYNSWDTSEGVESIKKSYKRLLVSLITKLEMLTRLQGLFLKKLLVG